MNLLSVFFRKTYRLETFRKDITNFGIVLKGKSVENLPKVAKEFNDCFIVNNFDSEMEIVGDCLLNKNIVHFVNRTMNTPLKPDNYRKWNIKEIQLTNSNIFELFSLTKTVSYNLSDPSSQTYVAELKRFPTILVRHAVTAFRTILHYQSLGLKRVFLPKGMISISKNLFGPIYANKFPNTGHLAIYYAANIIKPKNLWVIGLDFYQSDYLCRHDYIAPIEKQRVKIKRTNAVKVVQDWIAEHPETTFNIVTYYEGFKPQKNLKVINYS